MPSVRIRPVLAIGASLFALAAASLLDVARMQPDQVAAARGDRQNVASLAADCTKNSLIAACASGSQGSMQAMPPVTLVQVFQAPGKTTLVKVNAH
jgi:hypothetical protein